MSEPQKQDTNSALPTSDSDGKNERRTTNSDTKPSQVVRDQWRPLLKNVGNNYLRDEVSLAAPGVAFYYFLAFIPFGVVAVALLGLILEPQNVQDVFGSVLKLLPKQGQELAREQLTRLAAAKDSTLGWTTAVGILISLWSASTGSRALISAFNVIHRLKEERSFLKTRLMAMAITLCMILSLTVFAFLVAVLPAIIDLIPLESVTKIIIEYVRWPLLMALMMFGIALLDRYAPSGAKPPMRWVGPGAAVGATLWLIVSVGLSIYVSNFGSYSKTYGSLAGVILTMLWLYLTISTIIVGGIVNAEIRRAATSAKSERKNN